MLQTQTLLAARCRTTSKYSKTTENLKIKTYLFNRTGPFFVYENH